MRVVGILVALAGVLLALSGAVVANGMTSAGAASLKAQPSRYGKILFDGRGRVLYLFARDRSGRSSCYAACAKAWPPFLTRGAPSSLRGVSAKLVGTTKRRDGTVQVTYGKHPLYYYKGDTRPGEIKCQNVSEFGGLWLVVAPNGKAVR